MARRRGLPLPLLILLVIAVPAAGAFFYIKSQLGGDESDVPLSAPLRRGPMRVSVLESGSLEALESYTVRSRVEGRNEIIYIVPEGTRLTEEDVAAGKVLVKLDDSKLKEKIDKASIDVTAATNALENATANLEIQTQQNASDIRKAELDVRFGGLDLVRYVGEALGAVLQRTQTLVREGGIDREGGPTVADRIQALFDHEELEGEARQMRRLLLSDIKLAKEELSRARVKLEWSLKLEKKGYVAKDELEADKLSFERRKIELERADTALGQYAKYDFPKETEQLLSDLVEAGDKLSRIRRKAESNLDKATSDVETKRRQLMLQNARMEKFTGQLLACVIKAEKPGLVVYGSSGREHSWRDSERIAEGTAVRERQEIIRIPEPGSLGAKINVHESVVDKVRPGLPARIVVDAIADRSFSGVVLRRAVLPSSTNRWLNPNLKVYETTIKVEGKPTDLKPGMSVQAEIILDELDDALAVPVQSVAGKAGAPVVYVWTPTGPERREVELGLSNDAFIEVLGGLEEGDRVLLSPPVAEREQRDGEPSAADPSDGQASSKKASKPPAGRSRKGGSGKGGAGKSGG